MPVTIVRCSLPRCDHAAAYKIAALWTGGSFSELKTYAFACTDHLGPVFRLCEGRKCDYEPAPGETVEEMAIFKFEQGRRDRQLQRLWGLEENYRT